MEDFRPVLFTLCNEDEQSKLIDQFKKKYENGIWKGTFVGGKTINAKRPAITVATQKSRQTQTNRGDYKRVCVLASHVALLADGRIASQDDECSHLCHFPVCLDKTHLIWERGDFNRRRKRCQRKGVCVCGLEQKCIFGAHLP